MKVTIGKREQFYGETSDPAQANYVQYQVLKAIQEARIEIKPMYTGVSGPDVWFEVPDEQVEHLKQVAQATPKVTGVAGELQNDSEFGQHLAIFLKVERPPRRRRW